MTGPDTNWAVSPNARTSVLAVGVEVYGNLPVDQWGLPGAGLQAVRFAQWAIDQGVPAERVRVGCTWVDPDAGAAAVERLGARSVEVGNESLLDTIDDLMVEGGDLLLVYWCGHGVAGTQLERRLLTSGASRNNLANRFVADIQARFQSNIGAGFARQVFLIDACANMLTHQDGQTAALPDSRMQPLAVRKARQDFYFSTDVGEIAQYDKTTGTAAYSTAILTRLTETDVFPPDFPALFDLVKNDLDAGSYQHPVFYSMDDGRGAPRERWLRAQADRAVFGDRPRIAASFVERDQLTQLQSALSAGGVASICALSGMRGVGKSQLASAYAQQCERDGWDLVAWITATSRDATISQLAALAAQCQLAALDTGPDQAVRTLLTWLNSTTGDRLIVFDNVERYDDLTGLLPNANTRVILTSTTTGKIGTRILVGGYDRDQSIRYLTETTEIDDPDGAAEVADALGDLPVALTQATSTIRLTGLTFPRYLDQLRNRPLSITLRREDGDPYPDHVATALAVAIDTAIGSLPDDPSRDIARGLLAAMTLLADTGIPRAWADHLDGDPITTQLAIGQLIDASILTPSASPGTDISLHRLLGTVIRDTFTPTETEDAVNTAVRLIHGALVIPEGAPYLEKRTTIAAIARQLAPLTTQSHSAPLTHHREVLSAALKTAYTANNLGDPYSAILVLVAYDDNFVQVLGSDHPDRLASRNNLAYAYDSAGDVGRAIPLLEQTHSEWERILGPDHAQTLVSRSNLASTYASAGDLGRAIPLYEQTLTDRERILGPDHPDTLTSRNNLAYAYAQSGDLRRAIALYEHTVADMERILGPDHPDTLTSRNNLASLYGSAGDAERAETLFSQVLLDRERILGPNHPDTLTSRNNLAHAYDSAGDLARAIPLYEQTLTDMERILGPDHPNTLTSRNNLAGAYESAGELGRAIPLYEQTLSDRERILGPDHPDTLRSRHNVAYTYASAGDVRRAIPIFEQTLSDMTRVLGPDHPDTFTSRSNLAGMYRSGGDLKRAIALYEQNLTDRKRILGLDHPDTLTSRNNLASAYTSGGDLKRAIPLLEQSLTDRERILGPNHPDTLRSRSNLAFAYESVRDLVRAMPLYEQTVADMERILGPDHPDTLTSRNNLAGAYQSAGDLQRAIPLYEQNLADRERILGPDHPDTLTSRNNLADAYKSAGDLKRAIPLHMETLTDMERVLGSDHPSTLISRSNLADAYASAGDVGRAIPLYEQNLAHRERVLGPDHPDTIRSREDLALLRDAVTAANDEPSKSRGVE